VSLQFAAPAFLWLLAALPIVVLLHFLRARTRRVEVSALFLWQQARLLAERRRRWSPTWSLLAQLLAVTAAALALAQPDLRRGGPPDLVVVLDASASMAAVDPEGPRLERAAAVVAEAAADAGRVALVRAGLEPTLVLPFTTDRAALAAAVAGVAPGDVRSELDRAVGLARDLAGAGAAILLVSDDPGPRRDGVVRADVGGSGHNLGIVAFDLGIQQAFVAVASNSPRPRAVEVELWQDERMLAATELLVPAREQTSVSFPIDVTGVVMARLRVPPDDALALDDVAYAGHRALEVVMDQPVETMLRALNAVAGVAPRVTGLARTTPADVRVLTDPDRTALPAGDLIVLPAPRAEPSYAAVAEWDRAHPLLRFVDLREVIVGLDASPTAAEDGLGWQVLARSADLRPVLRYREDDERRVLEFMFHPTQTDLVLRPAFPTLIANVVERYRGEGRVELGRRDDDGRLIGEPGPVRVDGRLRVANLLEPTQTRLPGPGPDDLAEREPGVRVERMTPLAAWLVAAALLFLVAEWLLWTRGAGLRAASAGARPGRAW
jgi:Ca-activated chloride channel homolog